MECVGFMTETSEVTTYVNHAACQGYMVNTFYVLGAVLYLNVLYVEFFFYTAFKYSYIQRFIHSLDTFSGTPLQSNAIQHNSSATSYVYEDI